LEDKTKTEDYQNSSVLYCVLLLQLWFAVTFSLFCLFIFLLVGCCVWLSVPVLLTAEKDLSLK